MLVTFEVTCGDKTHRVGIDKKAAFTAFGAELPECLRTIEEEFARARRHSSSESARVHFGDWLRLTSLLTTEQVYELAFRADPLRRANLAYYGRYQHGRTGLSVKQRIALMRTRGIPSTSYGHMAMMDPDLPVAVRMDFARKATEDQRGDIAMGSHFKLPNKYRLELAEETNSYQQCAIARSAGRWLPSKKRAEYAWYCTENVIIGEVLHQLTPNDAFKLAKRFGPDHCSEWRGTHGGWSCGDYDNRTKVAMMGGIKLTPAQRVALVMSIPKGWRGAHARRLHRRRKHFELTPAQIKRLEKAMRY
jgi:hypothetical protein